MPPPLGNRDFRVMVPRTVHLADAPRQIRVAAQLAVCLHGRLATAGWIALVLSSIAVWNFPLRSELVTDTIFHGARRVVTTTTSGVILDTSASALAASPPAMAPSSAWLADDAAAA